MNADPPSGITQTQIHEELFEYTNKAYCFGRVATAAWLQEETFQDLAIREHMEFWPKHYEYKNVWNKRRRLAIDVSLPIQFCEPPGLFDTDPHAAIRDSQPVLPQAKPLKGRALYNPCEAAVVFAWIFFLLGSAKIPGEDIMVLTTTDGQCRHIRSLLDVDKRIAEEARKVHVCTLRTAHGKRAKVAVVSLVVNNAEEPGKVDSFMEHDWTYVLLDTAQRWLFLVGNFRGWKAAIDYNDKTHPIWDQKAEKFRGLIEDLVDKGDVMRVKDVHRAWYFSDVFKSTSETAFYYSGSSSGSEA